MDVIALSRAGFGQAVAPLGTALTEDQLALLWRAGPEPIMCFDGDKAGLRAAYRSIERALPLLRPGQSLRFALLPEGQDPDDLIRAKGAPAMGAILDNAIALVDMLWQRELTAEPLSTPEDKAGLKGRLFAALNEIGHEDVKQLYRTELLGRFDKAFGFQSQKRVWQGSSKPKDVKSNKAETKAAGQSLADNTRRETALLGAILEFPELLDHVDERFFALKFQDGACSRLQRAILSYWRTTKEVEKQSLHAHIENQRLVEDYRVFTKKRLLIKAAMGGADAQLTERAAIWNAEADALMGQGHVENVADSTRSRMAETLRTDNKDVLRRLMRASKDVRD
ncbi:MAG: toprim domain-containing protein, partial [Litorimonas sp.]